MIISNARDITVAPQAGNVSDWLAATELAGNAAIQAHVRVAKNELALAHISHTKAVNQALAGQPSIQWISDAAKHLNLARAQLDSLNILVKAQGSIAALKNARTEFNLVFSTLRETKAKIKSYNPTLKNQIAIFSTHVINALGYLTRVV
jgi:hypothetical protein